MSVSLLYADADLSARIATARDRQRQAGTDRAWRLPARSLVTEQSLRTDLANAKERTRRLAEEVTVLRAGWAVNSALAPTSPVVTLLSSTSSNNEAPSLKPRTTNSASASRSSRPRCGSSARRSMPLGR